MEIEIKNHIIKAYWELVIDIFTHKYTHYWLKGGRMSTKSSFIAIVIVLLIISKHDINALCVRKVKWTLKDSVYNQILWAIDELNLEEQFVWKVSPLEITHKPTGNKIYFRGLDDPLKIKSIRPRKGYIAITWFEELDEYAGMEEIRSVLQSANRGGDLVWAFYSFNPPKTIDNWANQEVGVNRRDKVVKHTTYLDVSETWIGKPSLREAEVLKEKNELAYRHEYLGEVTGTGGTVFDNVEKRPITQEEIDSFGYRYEGIDFGFAVDPFVWVRMAYDKKKTTLYIFDEIFEVKLSNKAAVEKIKGKSPKDYATADSAEPKSIAEMNSLGKRVLSAKKGPDSVDFGMRWLQSLEQIVVDPVRCPNAAREFTCYEYERDKHGNFISRYPDKDNHTIDATRYAMETVANDKTIKWG